MKPHRVARGGMLAAVWAASYVLWTVAVPRTSWAIAIEAADASSGSAESRQIAVPPPTPNSLAAVTWTGSRLAAVGLAGTIPTRAVGTSPSTFAAPGLSAAASDWVRSTNACRYADSEAATMTTGSRVRRHIWRPGRAGLRLPYENLSDLVEARCYGVDPWDEATGEVHGGIDLIPRHTDLGPGEMRKAALIAPAGGTIHDLRWGAKPGKATAFILTMKLNDYWFVTMVLEPQNFDPAVADEQGRSIAVQAGQAVRRGDRIGDLVVTNVHYPHVHFMIYYKDPNQTYEDFLANFLLIPRNQGDNLPPTAGPGSPWAPANLGIPSTLFCPYVYLEPSSRSRLDQILKQSHDGSVCTCICAYGSKNADCGVCSQ
ncbi:MAG: hypothetical protein LAO05_03290 [Acidobacteriia bacterium]|nr:hypothetical protein [Terriglobia bacterium]